MTHPRRSSRSSQRSERGSFEGFLGHTLGATRPSGADYRWSWAVGTPRRDTRLFHGLAARTDPKKV